MIPSIQPQHRMPCTSSSHVIEGIPLWTL
ncbi:hypothetical protein RB2654_14630 [Rhodobacterales bacterium HTCC2654]|uniref:Uncharacterized protein n=1 Tax=Maritimibacter alkaliphilus HTCC2654 TaxID=314271 RepID=A3VGX5_9RHOB|nr:hypothetical protein RB2654_14630 [Rhodobacterales bacterium HTCC2654] [Maritimibacter alkaliphilus HTCC2654]